MESTINKNTSDTLAGVSAIIKELALSFDESLKKERAEREKSRVEFDESLKKERAEREKSLKDSEDSYKRRMKNLEDRYGSMSHNFGSFAEEYFFNSFENGEQDFFGEKFDSIERNLKPKLLKHVVRDEYDIVMLNGVSVAIVETKFSAHENDLPKIVKKAETFKINYPDFARHRIYLGLASMSFYEELEKSCIEAGIAIIKQVGETVVISDEHLKAF